MQEPTVDPLEAPEPPNRLALASRKRRKFIFWLRIAVIVFAFFGLWRLTMRYELVKLPEDACSPVSSYEPGTSLLVDRSPEALFLDDVVLFALPDGGLGIGRVTTPPGSDPGTLRTEAGYWLLGDAPDCNVPDSRDHGTFPEQTITARVLFPIKL